VPAPPEKRFLISYTTDPTNKTVFLANKTQQSWADVTFGVAQLGYDLRGINLDSDMTETQVINGNRQTPGGAVQMYAVLLTEADLPRGKMGTCSNRIDTKAICRFDFYQAQLQAGGDSNYLSSITTYMFGHDIGHALYPAPPSSGGMQWDGHELPHHDCFMDLRDGYDRTPPTSYCNWTNGLGDCYNCSVKHSIKGP
jgi:hypothetical protein